MTKRGDDAVLTTYDNNGKNSERTLPHLLPMCGNDAVQCLRVTITLARGGLTNNWVVGEGVALKSYF